MSCDVGEVTERFENELCSNVYSYNYELCSFFNLSVTSPTPQIIFKHFRRFTYIRAFPTLPLLYLRHSSFSNPSFASPASQALHLRHLANHPCISTSVTKFSQNIVADTDKNKALIDCHKCSSSFLSIVKCHPLLNPCQCHGKVRSGSCLKLFLIDCRLFLEFAIFFK